MKKIKTDISTEFIKLDAFLKLTGGVQTGGQAKAWVQGGKISVNGEICTLRGRKLRPGDLVGIEGEQSSYEVGRESTE